MNLNEKSVVDNKLFWKTVKPLLSDKVAGKDEIRFIENNELKKTDLEIVEVSRNFFPKYYKILISHDIQTTKL